MFGKPKREHDAYPVYCPIAEAYIVLAETAIDAGEFKAGNGYAVEYHDQARNAQRNNR